MKKIVVIVAALALAGRAEMAVVRIGYPEGAKGVRYEERTVELEKTGEASWRYTLPKAEIPRNAKCVEVVPSFMTARKGDDGYWMQARGTYGLFDKEDGTYVKPHQLMPVFGLKRGGSLWYGHVKTWRFSYDFVATAKKGAYEAFPRFDCARVRNWFPEYYDDIVVEFHRLDGAEADYNGLAHAYRKFQLDRGAVRTIKDRIKDYPELDYLCDAIVVRIQTHAAKPIPDKRTFYAAGEEPPIVVHMPFGVTEEFLQAIKDAGVDKLTVCSAGWQDGGYDGRVPGHFPVGAEAGGEEAFRRLIDRAHRLGYQFTLHASHTDGYRCSRMWSDDFVCKTASGKLMEGGLWAGGQCYWVCQRRSWDWVPDELKQMAALGVRGPHYIDVFSATYPLPCADPKHPSTWEQTAEYQNRILAEAKRLMGGAASESGYDHVAGNIDYINYTTTWRATSTTSTTSSATSRWSTRASCPRSRRACFRCGSSSTTASSSTRPTASRRTTRAASASTSWRRAATRAGWRATAWRIPTWRSRSSSSAGVRSSTPTSSRTSPASSAPGTSSCPCAISSASR